MRKLTTLIALSAVMLSSAAWAKPLNVVFTHHSSASNPFWQAVKKGFDDACDKIDAKCQMIFTQTEGAIDQQASNMIAALATKPDVLITSIVDNNAFDEIISRARANGTIVIAANVDDLEGANGNERHTLSDRVLPCGILASEENGGVFPQRRTYSCCRGHLCSRTELVGTTGRWRAQLPKRI